MEWLGYRIKSNSLYQPHIEKLSHLFHYGYMKKLSLVTILCLFSSLGWAQEKLSDLEKEIVSYLSDTHEEQISFLEKIVNINSGTHNHAGVREVGNVFARELEAIGFKTEWQNMPVEVNRAGHLVAKLEGTSGKCLLLLGHIDTVFRKDSPFQKFDPIWKLLFLTIKTQPFLRLH